MNVGTFHTTHIHLTAILHKKHSSASPWEWEKRAKEGKERGKNNRAAMRRVYKKAK